MQPDQFILLSWKKMQPGTREAVVIVGALLLVISLAFAWAAFVRKPRGTSHNNRRSRPSKNEFQKDSVTPKRKKWRRRRREHRPRNPTLAETGGLPPIRRERPGDPMP